MKRDNPSITQNREAFHSYHILETLEAGIALSGTEVKSLRNHQASLAGSFARLEKGELFIYNVHIAPYEHGSIFNLEPKRERKLLLHRSQIRDLALKTEAKGLTLVPLRLYFNPRGVVKVELALAKGKKQYDKRQAVKKRDDMREMRRALKTKRG